MRITNLHLIFSFLMLSGFGIFFYNLSGNGLEPVVPLVSSRKVFAPAPIPDFPPKEIPPSPETSPSPLPSLPEIPQDLYTGPRRRVASNLAEATRAIDVARNLGYDVTSAMQRYNQARELLSAARNLQEINQAQDLIDDVLQQTLSAPKLATPPVVSSQRVVPQAAASSTQPPIHAASTPIEAVVSEPEMSGDSYIVKPGDTLWSISKKKDVYGRGARWVKIWRANEENIPDFDNVKRGQRLVIPR